MFDRFLKSMACNLNLKAYDLSDSNETVSEIAQNAPGMAQTDLQWH